MYKTKVDTKRTNLRIPAVFNGTTYSRWWPPTTVSHLPVRRKEDHTIIHTSTIKLNRWFYFYCSTPFQEPIVNTGKKATWPYYRNKCNPAYLLRSNLKETNWWTYDNKGKVTSVRIIIFYNFTNINTSLQSHFIYLFIYTLRKLN